MGKFYCRIFGTLVHRAVLYESLHQGVPSGIVRFGVRIRDMHAGPGGVRVTLHSGEALEGALLVGADGIASTVRARFFGPTAPVYLGYRSHRFVVDNRDGIEHFLEFLGRGRRVGLVPIARDRLYVWTTFNSRLESRAWALESPVALRACFAEFTDPRVRSAFAQVRSTEDVLCTDIEELHQERWIDGRVVLLGDAAHALTPNMGQGAGMAMEDAAVLADELAAAAHGDRSLDETLARYASRRQPRVETVTRLSRVVGADGQRTGRLACWWRNRRLAREGRDVRAVEASLERLMAHPI